MWGANDVGQCGHPAKKPMDIASPAEVGSISWKRLELEMDSWIGMWVSFMMLRQIQGIPSILVTFFSQYISLLRLDNTAIPGSYWLVSVLPLLLLIIVSKEGSILFCWAGARSPKHPDTPGGLRYLSCYGHRSKWPGFFLGCPTVAWQSGSGLVLLVPLSGIKTDKWHRKIVGQLQFSKIFLKSEDWEVFLSFVWQLSKTIGKLGKTSSWTVGAWWTHVLYLWLASVCWNPGKGLDLTSHK